MNSLLKLFLVQLKILYFIRRVYFRGPRQRLTRPTLLCTFLSSVSYRNSSHLPTPFTLTASLFSVQIFPVQRAHKPAVSGSIASIDLRETFAFFFHESIGRRIVNLSIRIAYRWIWVIYFRKTKIMSFFNFSFFYCKAIFYIFLHF